LVIGADGITDPVKAASLLFPLPDGMMETMIEERRRYP